MLDRAAFNTATAGMNNNYDQSSADVLRADLKLAEARGDTRAAASIKNDLQRVGQMADTPITTSSTPAPSGSPVPDLQQALGEFTRFGEDVSAAIFGGERQRQQHSAAQSKYTVQQATELAQATMLQAESAIAEDTVHRQLLRAVGLDINDPSSALNQELLQEQRARSKRELIRNRMVELESTNFFENPIDFIMNQPELQRLTAQHNQLADVENRSSSEIARMQSLATTLKSLTPAKNADLLRQTATAQAAAVVSRAQAVAEEISAQNAAGSARALLDTYTIKKNVFGDLLQLRSLEENINDRRQRLEDTNFWRGIAREDRKEKEEEKAIKKQQEAAIVIGINTYRKAISGNVQDVTLEDVKRMPQNIREAWFNVVLRGNYGNSYGQSIPFISEFGDPAAAANSGNATMMYTVRSVKDRAMKMVPQIINAARAQGMNLKESDALARAYEQIYNDDRNFAIKGADKSQITVASPYAFDWDALASQAEAAKGTGVVSSILMETKARAPGMNLSSAMTPRNFLSQVEAKVVSKQVDPKTAAQEVARFFAVQSTRQYETAGLKYLGLPQMVDFTITPGASGREKVDLMNPTQLENYLTSRIAAEKRSTRAGMNNSFIPWR